MKKEWRRRRNSGRGHTWSAPPRQVSRVSRRYRKWPFGWLFITQNIEAQERKATHDTTPIFRIPFICRSTVLYLLYRPWSYARSLPTRNAIHKAQIVTRDHDGKAIGRFACSAIQEHRPPKLSIESWLSLLVHGNTLETRVDM